MPDVHKFLELAWEAGWGQLIYDEVEVPWKKINKTLFKRLSASRDKGLASSANTELNENWVLCVNAFLLKFFHWDWARANWFRWNENWPQLTQNFCPRHKTKPQSNCSLGSEKGQQKGQGVRMVTEKEKHSYESPLPDQKSCCQPDCHKKGCLYRRPSPAKIKVAVNLSDSWLGSQRKNMRCSFWISGFLDKQVSHRWGRRVLSE